MVRGGTSGLLGDTLPTELRYPERMQLRLHGRDRTPGEIARLRAEQASGRDVVIFEDVVDTGLTLRKLLGLLGTRGPRSVKIAALLKKDLPENADLPVDFLGFTIGPEFVVGYGLDLDEKYRNLPYVAIWDPSK